LCRTIFSPIITPENNIISYTYSGKLLKSVTWDGKVKGVITRDYNNDFKLSKYSVGDKEIAFTYDNDGQFTSIGDLTIPETDGRDQTNGLLKKSVLGNIVTTFDYNNFGQQNHYEVKQGDTSLYSYAFTDIDKYGRVKIKSETIGGVTTDYRYVYDLNERLSYVYQNETEVSHYTYNKNGNSLTHNAISATYDDQDRLLTYGANSYTYSAKGDLETKTTPEGKTTYNYDEMDNLQSVTMPDGTAIDYVIDGMERRIAKKVGGVITKRWIYKDSLNPIAEVDADGKVTMLFVYGEKSNVPSHLIKDGVTYRVVSDHLGSVRLVVNSSTGEVVQKMRYDEFGLVLEDSNPEFQPFGFAGGLYDVHTKLVRFGARDYDAETGRWTAKDPIDFGGETTLLYEYCGNDPVNKIDVTGYFFFSAAPAMARPFFGPIVTPKPIVIPIPTAPIPPIPLFFPTDAPDKPKGCEAAEHTKNKTKSNKQKHQNADKRRDLEQQKQEDSNNEQQKNKKPSKKERKQNKKDEKEKRIEENNKREDWKTDPKSTPPSDNHWTPLGAPWA